MTTQTHLRIAIALLIAVGYSDTHPLSRSGKVFNIFLILTAVLAGAFLIGASTQVMLQFELNNFLGRRRMQRELAKIGGHYIICGAGRVGRCVAGELHARGAHLAFIEKNAERSQWGLDNSFPVVIGNAHSEEALTRSHIDSTKGLIAAVTSDAENLYIVLTAHCMKPDMKIIARASEEEATPKLLLAEQTLGATEIRQQTGALILALKRADGSISFNPHSDTTIQSGDYLIAVGRVQHLRALASFAQN